MSDTVGTVMVVDDDPDCRDLYELWLTEEYEVAAAPDGAAALERLDGSIDVVLLDREMPETRGEAVAAEIEARDLDPFVVMISGVEPDVDLLTMPVDDYLTKPIVREDVLRTVDRIADRTEYGHHRQTLLALQARKTALESRKHEAELRNSEAYRTTCDEIDALRQEVGTPEGEEAAETPSAVEAGSTTGGDGQPSGRFSRHP